MFDEVVVAKTVTVACDYRG